MTGGSSDDSRSEPTGTPELGNTALSPEVASVNKDLELLRLRVLASRKRKLKEEGEVSDSEEPLPSQGQDAPSELPSLPFPSRPRSLSRESGSFRGRPAFVGRKRKCAGGMTTMVAGGGGDPSAKLFQSLEMEARQFSDSFHPQSCTVVLDDEEQHGEEGRPAGDDQCYEDETVSDDVRLKDAIEPSPLINELRQREIARQKELLSTTRTQMALIDEDLTVLTRQLEETEKVTRVAVEKQQRLKAQLRETKALIHRSKHLKMQNLTRQSALRMERGQKVKLISVLQGSILAKLQESAAAMAMTATCASPAAPVAISTPSLFAETGGSSDRRELKIFTDATSSSSSEEEASAAIDSKAMVATVGLPSRSTEINQLERKALSIQRDLIAAQISLLRTRQAQQQRSRRQQQRDKVKLTKKTIARRAKQSRALGKVMAVTPIQAPSKSSVMEAEDPSTTTSSDLGSYFPPFLHHLGGSLLEASTLGDLIQSLSEMILINCQEKEEEEEEEEGGPNLPSNIDEATGTLDSPQVTQSLYDSISEGNNLSIEEGEILGYVPYLSPLRIFSSYRFSPCFSAFAAPKQGLLSGTFTNRINPFAIICQTELEGSRCTRRNCPGQHFRSILLSDADVLEDFMRTLLAIPIQPGSPYRDHVEVTTAVKQRLLTMTDKRVPLISLVGVLLDVCKRMTDGGEHVISFVATPQAGPEGNKLTEVTSLTAVHRITNEVSNVGTAEVVPMATQTGGGPPLRHLIMGVADHRRRWGGNGDSVGSRYFPPSYPSDELVGEGTDERRDVREQKGGEGGKTWNEGEREEEGKGEVSVLGVFIKTLSLPSTSWEESMIVLREGLARYPRSTLLTAVTADVGKAGQTLDTSCLSLVRALDRYRSGATELGDLLAEVETMELPAASVGKSLVTV